MAATSTKGGASVPAINLSDVHPSTSAAATPRRLSGLRRLFTPRFTPRSAAPESARMRLPEVIEVMKDAAFQQDDKLEEVAKRFLALIPDLSKVERASNAGGLDAIVSALHDCGPEAPEVASHLLPVLINLSTGDDDAGARRAAHLVEIGAIQEIAAVMFAHPAHRDVQIRSVWALQHLCRRGVHPAGTAPPWLGHVVPTGLPHHICTLAAHTFPDDLKLRTRVAHLLASLCYALHRSEPIPGVDAIAVRAKALPTIVSNLQLSVDASTPPIESERVHEASALALGDACLGSAELARAAVDATAIEAVCAAMATLLEAPQLLINGCDAIAIVCESADADDVLRVVSAGAPRAVIGVLRAGEALYKKEQIQAAHAQAACMAATSSGGTLVGGGADWMFDSIQFDEHASLLKASACRALAAMAAPSACLRSAPIEQLIGGEFVLEAVTGAVVAHPHDWATVVQACRALSAILAHASPATAEENGLERSTRLSRARRAARAGAVPGIALAVKKHAKHEEAARVREAAVQALLAICVDDDLRDRARKLGVALPKPSEDDMRQFL